MKQLFCLILILLSIFTKQIFAFQFGRPGNYNFIEVKELKNSTEIYIKNDQNQKFLVYKSNFPFSQYAAISVEYEENPDIIWLDFDCDKNDPMISCSRFFNRKTSQMRLHVWQWESGALPRAFQIYCKMQVQVGVLLCE